MIPPSRQLPQFCPRRIVLEEVQSPYAFGCVDWKVTIGGKSAYLSFDEALAVVSQHIQPHTKYPLFWTAFQSDEEFRHEQAIKESRWKLRDLGCLKESTILW